MLSPPAVVVAGERYGRLVVIGDAGSTALGQRRYKVRCDCGKETTVVGASLRRGATQSCGCLHRERFRHEAHGRSGTPEYRTWQAIIQRCTNPKDRAYQYYGARGVKICERWRNSFAAFLADMGPKPGRSYSIDRIDEDGNYEPGNCRWVTISANSRRAHLGKPHIDGHSHRR